MAEQHSIDEAIAHLGAALAQSIAEDDQIIMGHVRDAHTLLKPLHSAYVKEAPNRAADLVAALEEIVSLHLGDCPAAMDEVDFARAHCNRIRRIAHTALTKATT